MNLYRKVILDYESDSELVNNEIEQMTYLVNQALCIAKLKPSIANRLDEDPVAFFDDLLEDYVSHRVEKSSDLIHGKVEETREIMKFIKEGYEGLHNILRLMPEDRPEEIAREIIDSYVSDLQEARDVVRLHYLDEILSEV